MIRWPAFLFTLALSCAVHATPDVAPHEVNPSRSENVERILKERGLLERGLMQQTIGQIEQVGQSVRDRTSDLVGTAMGFLGVPYRRGGNSAATGFDCSGFVRATFEKTVGLILPRRANEQAAATDKIDKSELRPGDLVFFNTMRRAFSHVGIYVGDGKFIHAPRAGAKVRVEDMSASYWQRRFDGARRVVSDAGVLPAELKAQD